MQLTAPIGMALALAAFTLGTGAAAARADEAPRPQPQQDRTAPPDAHPQPVRIILPAPWQPAAPARLAAPQQKPHAN